MIEPDEDLRRLLHQWEAPLPGAGLDARVRASTKRSRPWKWLPIAAGLSLAIGIAAYWPAAKKVDSAGFQPLPNGAITVMKTGERL